MKGAHTVASESQGNDLRLVQTHHRLGQKLERWFLLLVPTIITINWIVFFFRDLLIPAAK